MYQLKLSSQPNLLANFNQKKVANIYQIKSKEKSNIGVRHGNDFIFYEYSSDSSNWNYRLNQSIFSQSIDFSSTNYPWWTADLFNNGEEIIILRNNEGLLFYQPTISSSSLKFLAHDEAFHDVHNWNNPKTVLLIGRIYSDQSLLGVLSRNVKNEINFYDINKEEFSDDQPIPLYPLNNLILNEIWKLKENEIYLTNWQRKGQDSIILRTINGLEIYKFNDNFKLEKIGKTSQMALVKNHQSALDKLFFADLTDSNYKDILHLNESGLFVYQYYENNQDFKMINYDEKFSKYFGWLPEHSETIHFFDIDNNKKDDLLFSGPNGLSGLHFDLNSNSWQYLIDPEKIDNNKLRYAIIVGAFSMPQKIIFIQDNDYKLNWAEIVPSSTSTSMVTKSTAAPQSSLKPSIQWSNNLVPKLISRKSNSEKPILQLSEQLGNDFLKNVVDLATGQVRLNVPLIDLSSTTSWNFKFDIFYNNEGQANEFLGEGWSLSSTHDYILFDHHGSIFPQDYNYYLILQGNPQKLEKIDDNSDDKKQCFKLAESNDDEKITIEYYQKEQRWIIEGKNERTIYGTADADNSAKTALMWSLEWQNWRGSKRDTEKLQSVVVAWFINTRLAKNNQRKLFYDYDQDEAKIGDKMYTTNIRLKAIRDDEQQLSLTFNYANKNSDEYETFDAIDSDGNFAFPVPLTQSYYLQSYNLITSDYTQNLFFDYKIDNGKRILSAIKQSLLKSDKNILKFDYKYLQGKHYLKNCSSSTGASFDLNFDTINPPSMRSKTDVIKYSFTKKTKISYGEDFSIIVQAAEEKIIIKILNREMNEILNENLSCSLKESEIEDLNLQAFKNSFIILVQTNENQILYFFERKDNIWQLNESLKDLKFNKTALIRFSDKIISVADKNNLKIFENHDQSSWILNENISLEKSLTDMKLNNKFIVGYDDQKLWLFYYDINWKRKEMATVSFNFHNYLYFFSLENDYKNALFKSFEQNRLKISNNLIVLSSLQEYDGKLFLHVHLFLLNKSYEIVMKDYKEIQRKNVLEFEETLDDNETIYTLKYEKLDSKYKLKVTDFKGKLYGNIKKNIKNKNLAQDEIDKHIKDVNENETWKKFLSQKTIIDQDVYSISFSKNGIHCGNDILIVMKDKHFETKSFETKNSFELGKHFILESDKNDAKSLKLYEQNNKKRGKYVRSFHLNSPGQIINRYPAYLAYQASFNSVNIFTFKDYKTLGTMQTFYDEHLYDSDIYNLLTISTKFTDSQELVVRPLSTFLLPTSKIIVSQNSLSVNNVKRLTKYERHYEVNYNDHIYNEKVTIIPGGDKKLSGWYEETTKFHVISKKITKIKNIFDDNGQKVLMPFEKEPENNLKIENNEVDESKKFLSKGMLYDRSGAWLISNFMPYKLDDEMNAFYGFESYENNQIFKFNEGNVVKKGFSLTGENYLQLDGSKNKIFNVFEGTIRPKEQEDVFVASCWIRSSERLLINKHVSNFKAIIFVGDKHKMIGLLGQVKKQLNDWSYLELIIDLSLLKKMYEIKFSKAFDEAYKNNLKFSLPSPEIAKFKIKLKIAAEANQIIDLDHIRFSPISHDFEATIYNPLTGKTTSTIHSNGSITRIFHDHLQREIANTKKDDQIEKLMSRSKGHLLFETKSNKVISSQPPSELKFEPESGFYETFDENSWQNHWKIDDSNVWQAALGQLWHVNDNKHQMKANSDLFDEFSSAIRLSYSLNSSEAILNFIWSNYKLSLERQSNKLMKLTLNTNPEISVTLLPSNGELIVMIENSRLIIWINGVILIDQALNLSSAWSNFSIEAQKEVLIEKFFVLNRPHLKIQYFDALGEKTQLIHLEDEKTVQVTEILYDELGRPSITTKNTRITRKNDQSLLAFYEKFVENKNPNDSNSVWNSGHLKGEVDQHNFNDKGFAYTRTKFAPTPLNEKEAIGLPGKDFSVNGRFVKKFSRDAKIPFLYNLFPFKQGYRQKAEYLSNGSQKILIIDKNNHRIAKYIRVPGFDHQLSTYEYDENGHLLKILPPIYHEKVKTSFKTEPWQSGEKHLTDEEKKLQKVLGIHYDYDDEGELIKKTTPDSGTLEYLYTPTGQIRFIFSLDAANETDQVTFFDYDAFGKLTRTGYLTETLTKEELVKYSKTYHLPDYETHQEIISSDNELNPAERGKIKRVLTFNEHEPVFEDLKFNDQNEFISKTSLLLTGNIQSESLSDLKKHHKAGKLHILVYPKTENDESLELIHTYNKKGQLIALGTQKDPNYYVKFTYNADGQISSEIYQLNAGNFMRKYNYNSPGFLDQISDPFITENIYYTEDGYGQEGFGDGIIMKTSFNATWTENADKRLFELKKSDLNDNQYARLCIEALKRNKYLSISGRPLKELTLEAETSLPILCGGAFGLKIAQKVAEKQFPSYYGHRYAYGNHQELIKAKYFTKETEKISPLQPDSFSKEINNLTLENSHKIWKILKDSEFIISDRRHENFKNAIGNQGNSFLRDKKLLNELKTLTSDNNDFTPYAKSIKKLALDAFCKNEKITLAEFKQKLFQWEGLEKESFNAEKLKSNAENIYKMLTEKNFLPTQTSQLLFDDKFVKILNNFKSYLPQIVCILSKHFAHALGENAFDLASYDIDANGNHRHFYTGFKRYNLNYQEFSNKISSILINQHIESQKKEKFDVKHNSQGNIIQALHKGIKNIDYHPVSQRTTQITLVDGRTIKFAYDFQGERILKQVFTEDDEISNETHYLRDEKGRVLMDQKIIYFPKPQKPEIIVTKYIYGPRGLIGFIRNKIFYNVTTDHAGSIRLVIKNGKVVAAYDYLPYGELMRSYGNDPNAQIAYRYTGQEYDEETGLYNYHARLYDPSIGRFYQIDPQEQYFSPYKYAGNSPISVIDPDGEVAFLIILAFALLGAYLGGAAANNRWNPLEFDFEDPNTYFGIIGGAIAGAFLPVSASVSFGFFSAAGTALGLSATGATVLGVAGTALAGTSGVYLFTASANDKWDPTKWEWDRPKTWNAAFQGFGTGVGIVGGVAMTHDFALRFAATGKKLFLSISYGVGASAMYGSGVMANEGNFAFWQWDWESPGTYSALLDGFDTGLGWPQNVLEMTRGVKKLFKNHEKVTNIFKNLTPKKIKKLKLILNDVNHPLYKMALSVMMGYYMASAANGNFDLDWKNSYSTYEAVLNGIFFGKDSSKMLKSAKIKLSKNVSKILAFSSKLEKLKWTNVSKNLKNYLMKKIFDKILLKLFKRKKYELSSMENSLLDDFKGKFQYIKDKSVNQEDFGKFILENSNKGLKKLLEKTLDLENDSKITEQRQKEVVVDEEVDFLNCRNLRRKKRSNPPSSTVCGGNLNILISKPEISEWFFYSKVFFMNHFNNILKNTPITHATADKNFFSNAIVGAMATLPKRVMLKHGIQNVYLKTEQLKYVDQTFPIGSEVKKILIVTNDNVMLKIIVNEPNHNLQKSLVNVYEESFVNRFKTLTSINANIDNASLIKGVEIFFLNKEKSEIRFHKFDHEVQINNSKGNKNEFEKIMTNGDKNLDQHLDDFLETSSNDSIKKFCQNLLDKYLTLKIGKNTNKPELESDFHAFLYGALSHNFKYKYNLDINVERIAGRGYSDLMFLSRKDLNKNKNWNAIPIIIELKSATDATSHTAMTQIKNKGYVYNLSMRTIAEKAIVVGIDSFKNKINIDEASIPKSNGFYEQIFTNSFDEIKIKQELNHIFYSISPLAFKYTGKDTYTSRLMLGQLLSRNDIEKFHILANDKTNSVKIVFKALDNEWKMLNLNHKDHASKTNNLDFPNIIDTDNKNVKDKTLRQIDVTIDPIHGKDSVSTELNIPNDNRIISDKYITMETTNFIEMLTSSNIDLETIKNFSKTLSDYLVPIKSLINSESDFQAVLHGLFLGMTKRFQNDNKIFKIFPESNFSKKGRVDLVLSLLDVKNRNEIKENMILAIELKYIEKDIKDKKNVMTHEKILNQAMKQVTDYSNYKSASDEQKLIAVAMVFSKEDGKVYTKIDEKVTDHSSISSNYDLLKRMEEDKLDEDLKNLKRSIYDVDDDDDDYNDKSNKNMRTKRQITFTENFENNQTFSQENQINFWPLKMIKNIKSKVSNITENLFYKPSQNFTQSSPNVLEMGDKMLAQTDLQGNLIWANLLIRKLTGKNFNQMTEKSEISTSELYIKAIEILDNFMSLVLKHSISCGISVTVRHLIIDQNNLQEITGEIYQKLSKNDAENITKFLIQKLIIKNIEKIAMKSTQKQADKFLKLIKKDELKFKETILNDYFLWLNEIHFSKNIENQLNIDQNETFTQNISTKNVKYIFQSNNSLLSTN